MAEYKTYELGDFELKSGGVITKAKIAYKTFGDSSLPVIIYPTWYSGGKPDLILFNSLHTVQECIRQEIIIQKLTTSSHSNIGQRMAHRRR